MGAKKKNLDASIGQTYPPINETFWICVNRGAVSFWFFSILFCTVGLRASSASRKSCEVDQIKMVIKEMLSVEVAKISDFQKSTVIKDLKVSNIALANYGTWNSLSENQGKIGILAESDLREAGELLQAIFDYYKLLLCFYCLKGAFVILPDKGRSLLPAVECFFTFLWDEDKGWQKNKPEKMKFIKSVMIVVDGVENALVSHSEFNDKNIFVRQLLQKIYSALPECDLERQHLPEACHRCSALNVIDMVALGIIEKKILKKTVLQRKSYRFFKIFAGAVVGCVVVWKIGKVFHGAGYFSEQHRERCMEFIKKHAHFK